MTSDVLSMWFRNLLVSKRFLAVRNPSADSSPRGTPSSPTTSSNPDGGLRSLSIIAYLKVCMCRADMQWLYMQWRISCRTVGRQQHRCWGLHHRLQREAGAGRQGRALVA
jgi:hypothetical protein